MLIANKYAKYVKYSVQVEQLEVYQEFKNYTIGDIIIQRKN